MSFRKPAGKMMIQMALHSAMRRRRQHAAHPGGQYLQQPGAPYYQQLPEAPPATRGESFYVVSGAALLGRRSAEICVSYSATIKISLILQP